MELGTRAAAEHGSDRESGGDSSDRTVEVLTPGGQSCGYASLGGPAGHCDVAIGRDGTLSRSAYALDAGPEIPAECVLEFWPGAFGPAGF